MTIKYTNNASADLATSINSSSTSIVVQSGSGAKFPALSSGDYFFATLIDSSNNIEIVRVTARSNDTLTVVRAQDGTTARSYPAGSKIELRIVAAGLNSFAQLDDNQTFTGLVSFSQTINGNAATATTLQTARTINGVSFDGSANINVNNVNALTFNNGGAGAASGTTFNGGAAATISYNTIGAPSTTGDNATGTWGISVSGSAGSVSGTSTAALPTGALGSGTANSTTFLRGDRTWQSITMPSTDFDGVGSYALLYYAISNNVGGNGRSSYIARGTTIAGSSLRTNSRSASNNTVNNTGEAGASGASNNLFNNGTAFPTSNTVTVSGTWRVVHGGAWCTGSFGDYSATYIWCPLLMVRIS